MRMIMILPTLLLAVTPLAAHAALAPAGQSFKLKVSTSFEAPFTDCWTFASNGRFIHSPSLKTFPYQLTNLNTNANHWQALWAGRVTIAFSGTVTGTSITGDAVDALQRTYSITGSKVSGCGTPAPQQGGWHGR